MGFCWGHGLGERMAAARAAGSALRARPGMALLGVAAAA